MSSIMNEEHKIFRELVENHWVKAQDCSALNMYYIVCDVTNIIHDEFSKLPGKVKLLINKISK